jgi:hypothetical protein
MYNRHPVLNHLYIIVSRYSMAVKQGKASESLMHTTEGTKSTNVPLEVLHCIVSISIISNTPTHIIMQEPTEDDDAPIPPETVSNDSNMNHTVIVRRKAAKRTLPWGLAAEELDLLSSQPPPPPQAEDIPSTATKKRRLRSPFPHQQMKLLQILLQLTFR